MDDQTERDAQRRVMPRLEDDAVDALLDALARSKFRLANFGVTEDVKLDRYIVRRELGRGGMGVVFEAYDPVLMVPVALKLLHRAATQGESEADTRLQREARALAAVEGDHVVRVYSAGFVDRQAWIAMQFVSGPNLAEWLRFQKERGPLGWREVLAKFIDAAHGLASIHQAGLIHRDFKPQNAVVDPRGRVRVLDFGLATSDRRPVASLAESHFSEAGVTSTGALVGTLRYASPEQFVHTDLDHRSDQFSFCVSLFEALWGHAPFGDGTSAGRHLSTTEGKLPVPRPTTGDVPGWLTSAVLRGLSYAPDDRFPSMAALLHELTRDRRRPARIASLLLGGVLAGVVAAGVVARGPDPLDTCLEGQATIAALADSRTSPALASRVAAMQDVHAAACTDTHRGSAPDTLLARRHACLAAERATLSALLARAPDGDRERLIGELPPPANCLDEGLGRVAMPRDVVTQERVAAVDRQLAEAHAARVTGDYPAAADHAHAAVVAAEAADHLPALARAHFALGALERRRDHRDAAESALLAAAAEAGSAGDLPLQVSAWHELVRLALLGDRAAENAAPYLQLSAHVLSDLADADATAALHAEHADMRGLVAHADGRFTAAIADHTAALARWQRLADRTDTRGELAASLINRGRAHSEAGDHTAALVDHREALRLEIDRFGPDHPTLAATHRALAHAHLALADYPSAEREARRALALDTTHHAATDLARDLQVLVKISLDDGRPESLEQAVAHAAAMQQSVARNPDASPELRADAEFVAAAVAQARSDPAAEALWARVAVAYAALPGPFAACQQALAHLNNGQWALVAGRFADVDAAVARIDAVLPTLGELACPADAESQWLRAEARAAQGDLAGALPFYEAAVARSDASEATHADLLDALARALHTLRKDPDRVTRILGDAQRHYASSNRHDEARELARFLAAPTAK